MITPETDDTTATAEQPSVPFVLVGTDEDAGYCADGVCVIPPSPSR